jgi:hypothetical protein
MKWLMMLGLMMVSLLGSAGQAAAAGEQLNVQTVLKDALLSFEQSASQDPITQQRILTCLGQEAMNSGVLGEYSEFNPNDWQSISVSGLDLQALVGTVNQTMDKCQRQSTQPSIR